MPLCRARASRHATRCQSFPLYYMRVFSFFVALICHRAGFGVISLSFVRFIALSGYFSTGFQFSPCSSFVDRISIMTQFIQSNTMQHASSTYPVSYIILSGISFQPIAHHNDIIPDHIVPQFMPHDTTLQGHQFAVHSNIFHLKGNYFFANGKNYIFDYDMQMRLGLGQREYVGDKIYGARVAVLIYQWFLFTYFIVVG